MEGAPGVESAPVLADHLLASASAPLAEPTATAAEKPHTLELEVGLNWARESSQAAFPHGSASLIYRAFQLPSARELATVPPSKIYRIWHALPPVGAGVRSLGGLC